MQVHDPDHTHSLPSVQDSEPSVQGMLLQTESCLKSQRWSPYRVKGPVFYACCTRKQKNGPSSADQALSIASYNNHHALSAKAA